MTVENISWLISTQDPRCRTRDILFTSRTRGPTVRPRLAIFTGCILQEKPIYSNSGTEIIRSYGDLVDFSPIYKRETFFLYFLFAFLHTKTPPEKGSNLKGNKCSQRVDHFRREENIILTELCTLKVCLFTLICPNTKSIEFPLVECRCFFFFFVRTPQTGVFHALPWRTKRQYLFGAS